jgi:hypothetical protein
LGGKQRVRTRRKGGRRREGKEGEGERGREVKEEDRLLENWKEWMSRLKQTET